MNKEILYASDIKLSYHTSYLLDICNNPRPIELVFALTDKCNLSCSFCYVKNRVGTDLDINKIKKFIEVVNPKSVELTGGEPTIYPQFNDIVNYLYENNIDIGMTTNGYKLDPNTINKMKWIRISINSFIETNRSDKEITELEKTLSDDVVLGFNYIVYNFIDMNKIRQFVDRHKKIKYCRLSIDMNASLSILGYFNSLKDDGIIIKGVVPDCKPYGGVCYYGYIKPFIGSNGNVYLCCKDVSDYDHNKEHSITDIDHPEKLLRYKEQRPNCKVCFYYNKNKFIDDLSNTNNHKNFM